MDTEAIASWLAEGSKTFTKKAVVSGQWSVVSCQLSVVSGQLSVVSGTTTDSVHQLIKGEYQVKQFREGDRIESPMFPELNLTAQQVFSAGE